MKRRKFLGKILLGTLISYLTSFWHKSSSLVRANKKPSNYVSVGSVSKLKKEGKILDEESSVGAILIMYDSQKNIIAIDPTCTHSGCIVNWKKDKNAFVCPCHDSKFTLQGKVIKSQAPARFPLKTYQVEIDGDSILVKPN
jgi:cytochrome b6-f complex iron-sulfur subunit